MFDEIKAKLSSINEYLANKGIVFPFIRDNGKPSVSLTLLMLSFLYWSLGILEIIKDLDLDKAENGVMIMAGLYFSRKITKDKSKMDLDSQQPEQGDSKNVAK